MLLWPISHLFSILESDTFCRGYPIECVHGFVVLSGCGYIIIFRGYYVNVPISFWVASLALGQSYDCPNASDATRKDMDKINHYETTPKINA